MENPFKIIMARLDSIETLLIQLKTNNTQDKAEGKDVLLMNVNQVSEYLNIVPATLYGYTMNRKIPHFKKGKRLYFNKTQIDAWMIQGKVKTIDEIKVEASNYIKSSSKRKS
jgi:excisionase family DNA binding protein